MEQTIIFDEKEKRKLFMICFLPGALFMASLLYYIIAISPIFTGVADPDSLTTYTLRHYNTMIALLGIFAVVTVAVLIYSLTIMARLKYMPQAQKMMWVAILCILAPLSFILFWTFVINQEPDFLPTYPVAE